MFPKDSSIPIGVLVLVAALVPVILLLFQSGILGIFFAGLFIFPLLIAYISIFGFVLILLRRTALKGNLMADHVISSAYALVPAVIVLFKFFTAM